jgi:regulator of protease activity HflC (stomatin/prohibitin superfamily)
MVMQAPQAADLQAAASPVTERKATSGPGVEILVFSNIGLVAAIVLLLVGIFDKSLAGLTVPGALLFIPVVLGFQGLTPVIAGEARVVQLFGNYQGTVRDPGLQWVNPLSKRRRVSTRIRNHETPQAKVNDADGNPIEIAAVVVWQVEDTAKALYAVDDFVQFVATQAETAVRHIATSYAYEVHGSGKLSLRDNADEITQQLSAEIQARVASAGVKIIESRLTRLSYASEIAQAMLRRQAAWSSWP